MPEEATVTETVSATTTESEGEGEKQTLPPELKAIIDKERSTARDAEKARKAMEKELNELRQQSMSDVEKAVEQAKKEGRQSALTEVGTKIAAAEIRAAAAGRLTDDQVNALVGRLNLASFLDDNGDVDRDAVTEYVTGIAPEQQGSGFPDLGQGARGGASKSSDMNTLIRRAAGRG